MAPGHCLARFQNRSGGAPDGSLCGDDPAGEDPENPHIPLEKIRRIRIYINTARKSLAAIKKETGADYILNGTLYSMQTFRPNCHLKAEGQVLACPDYAVAGYAWNQGPDIAMAPWRGMPGIRGRTSPWSRCRTDGGKITSPVRP